MEHQRKSDQQQTGNAHERHRQEQAQGQQGMVEIARTNEEAHLRPAPGAAIPLEDPFPAKVRWGLVGGAGIGAVVGLLFARLLLDGALVVPGWAQLYSMNPTTFGFFWMGMGIAFGIVIAGIGTILAATGSEEPGLGAVTSEHARQGQGGPIDMKPRHGDDMA